jgi:hypothetical protein
MNMDGVKKIYYERLEKFYAAKKILTLLEKDNFLEAIDLSVYMEIMEILRKVNMYIIANHLEENILIGDRSLIYKQLKEELQDFIKSQT